MRGVRGAWTPRRSGLCAANEADASLRPVVADDRADPLVQLVGKRVVECQVMVSDLVFNPALQGFEVRPGRLVEDGQKAEPIGLKAKGGQNAVGLRMAQFAELSGWGLHADSPVVVVFVWCDAGGCQAFRFWWLARAAWSNRVLVGFCRLVWWRAFSRSRS